MTAPTLDLDVLRSEDGHMPNCDVATNGGDCACADIWQEHAFEQRTRAELAESQLATVTAERDRERNRAAQYEQDWVAAKYEFGIRVKELTDVSDRYRAALKGLIRYTDDMVAGDGMPDSPEQTAARAALENDQAAGYQLNKASVTASSNDENGK